MSSKLKELSDIVNDPEAAWKRIRELETALEEILHTANSMMPCNDRNDMLRIVYAVKKRKEG